MLFFLQEARALRFLHRRAASGHARGIVKLLGTFNLSGHFCIVTGKIELLLSVKVALEVFNVVVIEYTEPSLLWSAAF